MPPHNSISQWIANVKGGDDRARDAIWEAYFPRLIRLAREQLVSGSRRVADEEDIVVSVFESFFRAANENRFPNLDDRDQLWRLLLRMTVRKARDHQRGHFRDKRGGGKIRGESAFDYPDDDERGIAQVIGDEPTPELAAVFAEEFSSLLNRLDDEQLRQIAVAKLEGCTNAEIAERLDCSESTVERRLQLIRKKWADQYRHSS